jgi:hypothetical protein
MIYLIEKSKELEYHFFNKIMYILLDAKMFIRIQSHYVSLQLPKENTTATP